MPILFTLPFSGDELYRNVYSGVFDFLLVILSRWVEGVGMYLSGSLVIQVFIMLWLLLCIGTAFFMLVNRLLSKSNGG